MVPGWSHDDGSSWASTFAGRLEVRRAVFAACAALVALALFLALLGGFRREPAAAAWLGLYPIVTLEKQLLNMIGNLV